MLSVQEQAAGGALISGHLIGGFLGSREEGTGKGWAEKKLEKQSSLGASRTSSTPELFCHPQTEWEYLFLFEWC